MTTNPRWLRWLHRVGYVTTAIVIAVLAVAGVMQTRHWLAQRNAYAELIDESRTHETVLLPNGDPYVRGTALSLLNQLPSLSSMHGNGLRFVVMPSFTTNYVLAVFLPDVDTEATGILLAANYNGTTTAYNFTFPKSDYQEFTMHFDKLTDGWLGDENGDCLDGSPMAFERIRGERTTSGAGNCSPHYNELKLLTLNALQGRVPGIKLPTESDWAH